MLKKTVTYEDFNGTTVTEDLYFNLSKPEMIELEVSDTGGFSTYLQTLIDSNDNQEIIATFKKLLLASYGVKSEDGRRFIKTDKLREEFEQSEAYSTLFMELAMDAEGAAAFVNGLVPKDIAEQVQKKIATKTVESPILSGTAVIDAPVPVEETVEPDEKTLREMSREELIEAHKKKIAELSQGQE